MLQTKQYSILHPQRNSYGKAIRKKYESGEVVESRHKMTDLVPRKDGISNTLTTVLKDNLLLETTVTKSGCLHRIRNLTPLEYWRLMDFSEEDFRKAESVNSNTQLYRQAGNSIVKNVLIAVFGQMIPGADEKYKQRK